MCRCDVRPVSERMLRRMGKSGPDASPAPGAGDPPPEWAYNVGEAAWGKPPAQWEDSKAWKELTPGNWQSAGRPEKLTARPVTGAPLVASTPDEFAQALRGRWGGDQKAFTFVGNSGFRYSAIASVQTLAAHLKPDRWPFAGFLGDVMGDPDEVYLAFVQSEKTGAVALRMRFVRIISANGKAMLAVMDAQRGELTGWTLYPLSAARDILKARAGALIYAKP